MARQLLQGWAPEEMGTASVTCPGAASPLVAPPSFSVVAAAATCHQTKPGPGPPAPHTTPVHTPVCQSPAAVTGTHAGVASLRPRPCTCTCCFCQPTSGCTSFCPARPLYSVPQAHLASLAKFNSKDKIISRHGSRAADQAQGASQHRVLCPCIEASRDCAQTRLGVHRNPS